MASVKITSLQMPVTDDVKANWKTIKRSILSNLESDWILTPECAMSGYFTPPTLSYNDKEKEQTLLDCMEQLEDFTATQRTGVICGTSWREADGYPYNQTRVYNNQGHLSCAYSKRLLTHRPNGGGELHHYLQGFQPSMFYVSEEKGILGSTLICNDAWATPMVSPEGNPYLISQLAQQGVKVIFVSANCNVPNIDWDQLVYDYHDVMLRTMAKQNNVWIVVSNSSLTMPMYWPNGDRVAPQPVDRVQVKSGIIAPNGEWLAWCDDAGEDSVTLDLEF